MRQCAIEPVLAQEGGGGRNLGDDLGDQGLAGFGLAVPVVLVLSDHDPDPPKDLP